MGIKVLVVEPSERLALLLEKFLRQCGFEPIVRVAGFDERVWRWIADPEIAGVVTCYNGYPFKRQYLKDIVDMERPGLPVLAFFPASRGENLYFDAELHSGNDFNLGDLPRLVAEHLKGVCDICARYRP